MDTNKLVELAKASPTAELMFTGWALRERHRGVTDVRRHRTYIRKELGSVFKEEDFYAVYAGLVQAGVGTVSYTFRGRPRYFNWSVPVQTVGKAGITGGRASVPNRQNNRNIRRRVATNTPPRSQGGSTRIYVVLPGGNVASVEYPSGSSPADIGNILKDIGKGAA